MPPAGLARPMSRTMVPIQKRPWASQRPSLKRMPGCGWLMVARHFTWAMGGSCSSTSKMPLSMAAITVPRVLSAMQPTRSASAQLCWMRVAQSRRWMRWLSMSTQYKAWVATDHTGDSPTRSRALEMAKTAVMAGLLASLVGRHGLALEQEATTLVDRGRVGDVGLGGAGIDGLAEWVRTVLRHVAHVAGCAVVIPGHRVVRHAEDRRVAQDGRSQAGGDQAVQVVKAEPAGQHAAVPGFGKRGADAHAGGLDAVAVVIHAGQVFTKRLAHAIQAVGAGRVVQRDGFALLVEAGHVVGAGKHHALHAKLAGRFVQVVDAQNVGLHDRLECGFDGNAAKVHDGLTTLHHGVHLGGIGQVGQDRKSTRLNSSHSQIS